MRRLHPSVPLPVSPTHRVAPRALPSAIGLALACLSGMALAAPQDSAPAGGGTDATDLDTVLVVGQRANRVSNGATNLDLAIKETPQSISVVSNEQMAQFERYLINEALEACKGSAAAAAERLGLPRKTLYDKMRRLGPLKAVA